MIDRKVLIGVTVIVGVCAIGVSAWHFRTPGPQRARGIVSSAPAEQAEGPAAGARIGRKQANRIAAPGSAPALNPADRSALEQVVLRDQFAALVQRARRDPAFAYSFASALDQCARADHVYESLSRIAGKRTPEKAEAALKAADATFAKCRGLTTAQLDVRLELMAVAARAGILEAQVGYRELVETALRDRSAIRRPNAVDEYRSNVESFTQAAAQSGDYRGLYAAYKLYSDGTIVSPDLVRAYQYAQAFSRLQPGAASQQTLAWLAARMTPEQLRRAQAR